MAGPPSAEERIGGPEGVVLAILRRAILDAKRADAEAYAWILTSDLLDYLCGVYALDGHVLREVVTRQMIDCSDLRRFAEGLSVGEKRRWKSLLDELGAALKCGYKTNADSLSDDLTAAAKALLDLADVAEGERLGSLASAMRSCARLMLESTADLAGNAADADDFEPFPVPQLFAARESPEPPAANAADDDDWRFPVPSVTNPPDPAALKRERRLRAWDTSDGSVPFPVPELFPKRGGYDPELQRRLKRDAKLRTNPREGRR